MAERLGNVIYLAACLVAGLSAFMASFELFRLAMGGPETFKNFGLRTAGVAVSVWICGWTARYILSGNRSIKLRL